MKPRFLASLGICTIVICAAVAPRASAIDLFWDADGNVSAATGGTGNWDIGAGGAWRSGSSTGSIVPYDNTAPSGVIAQFGGTAGTVTLAGTITTGGMNFTTGGYTITGGTSLSINPVGGTFTCTTNGGTTNLNSALQYPTANTQIIKTGPGTLFLGNGGAGTTNQGFYTVTGGTFNSGTLTFDSILAMVAGNRLGTGGPANSANPQVVLDAGTLVLTQTGANNNLANTRGVRVNAAGGAISDGGSNSQIPSQIANNAGGTTALYLSNVSGVTNFQGIISGPGKLVWTGASSGNTATFQAANTYTGATVVNVGTLLLDFTGTNTGVSRLSSSTAVTLNGGTLSQLGTALGGQSTSQAINGLTISGNASVVNTSAGTNSSTLALGGVTRSGLGTLGITLPANGNITSTTANTNGIIGGWATVGGVNWASSAGDGVNPGNITAYSSYLTTTAAGNTAGNYLAASNVDVTSTPTLSGPVTVNSLRFGSAAANTLNLTGTNIISSGGLLVTSGVGANTSAINGGTLAGSAGGDLCVIQHNTAAALTIGSQIVNNSSATALVKSGAGILSLNNSNTYTGGTYLGAGTLNVSQNNAIGTGALTFTSAASLQAGGSGASLPNTINLGLFSNVFDTNGTTLTLNGDISNPSAVNNAIKANGSGTLVLAGNLNITGHATDTNNPALMMGNRNSANFNRGTVTVTGTGNISRISTGWDNTANVFNFASTGTVTMANDFVSGQSANGVGVVNFTTGTLNLQNFNIANWDGAYGGFTMSGGTMNTTNLRNGGNGNGNGNSYSLMTGGTINVAEVTTLSRNGNGTNVLHLKGADAQFNEGNNRFNVAFSAGSTGIVTVDNGLLTVGSNFSLAEGGAGTTAVVNLNGGIIQPNVILSPNGNGTSIFNFNGGTLQARISNTNFMGGLTQANVYSGGAILDSNGWSITISQALQPAAGNGVSNIPVTTGGAGYLGIPVVKITGGGGTGATPVATVSGGAVTGIQITSPGTGYTSAPTVTLVGGGATTAATPGTATLAANAADGGLTKIGLGTVTLSGASSYLATTTVNEGELAVTNLQTNGTPSSLGSGTQVLINGGSLKYTGGSNNNNFNRTIAVGANGATFDTAIAGFLFYYGSFTGSDPLNLVDTSYRSGELLVTGDSPAFTGEINIGNGVAKSGMVQYRSNNPTPFGTGLIRVNGGGILTADDGNTIPTTLGNNLALNGGLLATQKSNINYTGNINLEAGSTIGHPEAYPGSTGRITLSGVISGDEWSSLTISTATSVTLSNTNTYDGMTFVSKGTLLVNGSTTTASSVVVSDGATLGGIGTVNGTVETIGATSKIAPGNAGIGSLNTGSTVLTGILDSEIDDSTSDTLYVNGDLDVTGATANCTALAIPTATTYVLAKYTGTLTGTLTPGTLPPGYSLVHDSGAKEIQLVQGAAGFSSFMDGFPGLSPADKLPSADPDHDGVRKQLEYALEGKDTTVANASPGTLAGNIVTFTKRAAAVSNNDITYAIVESTTLGVAPSPWTEVNPYLVNNPTTISYQLPTGQPKEFVRLKVTQN